MDTKPVESKFRLPTWRLTRNHLYVLLMGALMLPVVVVACFAAEVRGVFFVALLASLFSGGGVWYVLRLWEMKMQRSVTKLVERRLSQNPQLQEEKIASLENELDQMRRGYEHQIDLMQSSVAKSKDEVHYLNLEMDKKLEEMRLAYLEFEDLRKEYSRLEEEYAQVKKEGLNQVAKKESLMAEYQRTISEQRSIIEKKQTYIAKLEAKVQDLMYEIRSLLHLEQMPPHSPSSVADHYEASAQPAPFDYSLQLQKYVEKAENQTGMGHLGGRFLDHSDSYAVDRRRWFEELREEVGAVVFVISLTEKKFLFVNPHVKEVLGWAPEKLMKEFRRLVVEGYAEWKAAISGIEGECETKLAIECKAGEHKRFTCRMAKVSQGPFTNHVVGILF